MNSWTHQELNTKQPHFINYSTACKRICVKIWGLSGRGTLAALLTMMNGWGHYQIMGNILKNRFYFTPSRLHRMGLLTNNLCWKCKMEWGTFIHAIWGYSAFILSREHLRWMVFHGLFSRRDCAVPLCCTTTHTCEILNGAAQLQLNMSAKSLWTAWNICSIHESCWMTLTIPILTKHRY